jgi:hypothetical protein
MIANLWNQTSNIIEIEVFSRYISIYISSGMKPRNIEKLVKLIFNLRKNSLYYSTSHYTMIYYSAL